MPFSHTCTHIRVPLSWNVKCDNYDGYDIGMLVLCVHMSLYCREETISSAQGVVCQYSVVGNTSHWHKKQGGWGGNSPPMFLERATPPSYCTSNRYCDTAFAVVV